MRVLEIRENPILRSLILCLIQFSNLWFHRRNLFRSRCSDSDHLLCIHLLFTTVLRAAVLVPKLHSGSSALGRAMQPEIAAHIL